MCFILFLMYFFIDGKKKALYESKKHINSKDVAYDRNCVRQEEQ